MAYEDSFFLAQRVEQAEHIVRDIIGVIDCGVARPVGAAIAALVDCYSMPARSGQCGDLMAPTVPQAGEPMDHNDQWAAARLGDMHADAVGLHLAVGNFAHSLPCNAT